jgi:enediyne polyketide synthase
LFVHTQEREQDGKDFIYDIEVRDAEGGLRQRWEGLRLRQVSESEHKSELAEPLFINYVERKLEELILGACVRVGLGCDVSVERSQRRERAIRQAVGSQVAIYTRPDGRPELSHGSSRGVSVSHLGRFTVAASSPKTVTCDVEAITGGPESVWRDLLGRERFALAEILAREVGEGLETSATRVWAACECLKKASAMIAAPLILSGHQESWVLLSSGQSVIATVAARLRSVSDGFVLGVLVKHATL